MSTTRLRRSLLFMPGDDRHKIEKGIGSGADSIIMDLEDGVAVERKEIARGVVVDALRSLEFGRVEKLVRINALDTSFARMDLATTLEGHPHGYVVPKVESAGQVHAIDFWLTEQERLHRWPIDRIRLLLLIESARGIVFLREIAGASPRIDALIFGAEDYTSSVGATRTVDGLEALYARSALIAHAAAFRLQAIDTPFVGLNNPDGLLADSALGAQLGYTGKLAIHPKQVAPIAAAFTPSATAIEKAQRVLAAFRSQQSQGTGAFALDGQMIDEPMARAARTVIARAQAAGIILQGESSDTAESEDS